MYTYVMPMAMVMPGNEPIVCFQHCESNTKVIWLDGNQPPICPLCSKSVVDTDAKIPPFRLPSPFCHSRDAACSVVVKPTVGSFLDDYTNSDNLHVGVTDSTGAVYHFDETGFSCSASGWHQCIAVPMLTDHELPQTFPSSWDKKLAEFSTHKQWTASEYVSGKNDCYDFALQFLFSNFQQFVSDLTNRFDFCTKLVLPRTTIAAKYIGLYRRLLREQVVVQHCGTCD